MCPTSEFPIWPGGRPTDSPHVTSVACGHSRVSVSITGVCAIMTAFPSGRGLRPQPSRTISPASGTPGLDMRRRLAQPPRTPLSKKRVRRRGKGRARSALGDVRRLWSLRSLGHFERDLVPFLQAAESVPDDRAVVDEHVGTSRALDEAEPLRLVEPFHTASFRHRGHPPPLRVKTCADTAHANATRHADHTGAIHGRGTRNTRSRSKRLDGKPVQSF